MREYVQTLHAIWDSWQHGTPPQLVRDGRWAEMTREMSDEVVHAFAAVGQYDEIVPRMRERFRGIGRLAFPLPPRAPRDEEQVRGVLAALREGNRAPGRAVGGAG